MSARRDPPVLRPPLAAYAGAWTALAILYAVLYVSGGVAPFMAVRGAVAAVLPNALFGLVSLRLARRWPVGGGWRRFSRLRPAVLGLARASPAVGRALVEIDARIINGAFKAPNPFIAAWQTVVNVLIHLALAGIGYAWYTAEALREARDRAAQADVLRARAELELLRSQLHPHFVLKVLHALLGRVWRDPGLADKALERRGELLRFGQWVQQTGSDWVPLAREWDFVRSYLELERMRLGDRLQVEIHADDAALQVSVPP